MDQTSQVLLDLIKSSLWGTTLPDYDSLYAEPVDWDAVFEEAKIQTVAGIAAPAVPDSAPPSSDRNGRPIPTRSWQTTTRFS